MKSGWVKGDLSFISAVEWVKYLRETLTILNQTTYKNEVAYKERSKTAYDLGTKPRSFESVQMVLCHTPRLTGKLHSRAL